MIPTDLIDLGQEHIEDFTTTDEERFGYIHAVCRARAAEEEAIELYKKTIKVAWEEGDETTHRLFREILAHEEAHHDTFTSLLEEI